MSDRIGQASVPQNAAAYFGTEVRALREALDLSQGKFADRLHYQQAQVSKVESGSVLASAAFAEALDRAAGTPGTYARLRAKLSRQGHPEWFIPYVELEKTAARVEDYSNAFVMGALQTAEYAEATFRATFPYETDEQIKARVDARSARREALAGEDPPLLWVILHEATLRTVVGSRTVMADQLRQLASDAATPHVTIQVLRSLTGAPAAGAPYTLLTSGDGATVLYTEAIGQGHVTDSAHIVSHGCASFERLRASARDPEESVALIREIAEEYDR